MLGTLQTILVEEMVRILHKLFIASPTNTLVESIDAKFRPTMLILYPPPIGPEAGVTLYTKILYWKNDPWLVKDKAVPAMPKFKTRT
jgi:hypothetical protein